MATTPQLATWAQPFTIADEQVIEGLDEETRAVVERYKRTHACERIAETIEFAICDIEDALRAVRKAVEA